MNEGRKYSDLSSVSGSENCEVTRMTRLSQNKLKTNKLSRSLRQTQQSPSFDSSYNCHKEFKTPKRHARIRPSVSHNADSPSNDSDLQQDIIWDPTSPTAVCKGKGVKKSSTNVQAVDISEIVNRIAPKNERPIVTESSLLQWIGDSAVPCTPEVHQPRTRKKSTRQNDVEDLMKLAKQFDFNMHQQDKDQVKDTYKGSVKQDADGLNKPGGLKNSPLPSLCEDSSTSESPASEMLNSEKPQTINRKPLGHDMSHDFDTLFDQSTQFISGRLSQISSSSSQEGRAPSIAAVISKYAIFGNGLDLGAGDTSAVSSAAAKNPEGGLRMPGSNRFVDDDWDNDDLLNDTIILEMTQNPDLFVSPKHSSTQIGLSPRQKDFIQKSSTGNGVPGQISNGSSGNGFDGLYQGKNPKSKNRSTFKLETNPNFHLKETLSGEEPNNYCGLESSKPGQQGGLQSRPKGLFQPHKATPLEPSTQNKLKTQTVPCGGRGSSMQRPVVLQSSSTASGSSVARAVQIGDQVTSVLGAKGDLRENSGPKSELEHGGKQAGNVEPVDVIDEDLDSIFASDSLWDDGDDDDLLCQVCEDVEKLSESQTSCAVSVSLSQAYPAANGLKLTVPSVAVNGVAAQNVHPGHQGQATGPTQCTFSRSISVPGSSTGFTKTAPHTKPTALPSGYLVQNNVVTATNCAQSYPQGSLGNWKGPHKFTRLQTTSAMEATSYRAPAMPQYVGNASSAKNPSGSHHSFKRHLSDPLVLTNKVFVPDHVPVKCSEAEIERKKQEALARRRLRMQMSQKHGGPT